MSEQNIMPPADADEATIRAAACELRFHDMTTEQIQSMPGRVTDLVGLVNTLMAQRKLMLDTLVDARQRISDSEYWWISSPDRGGFDVDRIDEAIAEASKPL